MATKVELTEEDCKTLIQALDTQVRTHGLGAAAGALGLAAKVQAARQASGLSVAPTAPEEPLAEEDVA